MTEAQSARQVRIVSRWDASRVLFTFDAPEGLESGLWLRAALEAAAESDANLTGANLTGANLTGANLTGANLTGANLTGADLTGANLTRANLTGADLTGADLTGANLTRANLTGADLTGANLTRANLTGADLMGADLTRANLTGADLMGANLMGANLTPIKADFFDVLLRAPREIAALREALLTGKVDGSTYEGSCACLVGTIANARGANYQMLGGGLKPDSSRPIERFFMGIRRGDTPETNSASKIAVEWVDEFTALMSVAAPAFVEVQS